MKLKDIRQARWLLPRRKERDEELSRVQFLRRIPLFSNLNRWQLQAVSRLLLERSYQSGEIIFEENQPGAALFIIESGEVHVEIRREAGCVTHLATLKSGAFLGELALLDQTPRSATACAVRETQCLVLFRNELERLVESNPEISSNIYRALAAIVGERLKTTNEHIAAQQVA